MDENKAKQNNHQPIKKRTSLRMVALLFILLGIGALASLILIGIYCCERQYSVLPVLWIVYSFCLISALVLFIILFLDYSDRKPSPVMPGYHPPSKKDYSKIIQLMMHSDVLNWQRLYYFLVFNSILLLAWVYLFCSNNERKLLLLVAFSFVSLIVSLLWAPSAMMRGIRFQDYYLTWLRYIEQHSSKQKTGIFTTQVDFSDGRKIYFPKGVVPEKYSTVQIPYIAQILGARKMLVLIPLIFAGAHFFLFVFSLKFLIDKLLN